MLRSASFICLKTRRERLVHIENLRIISSLQSDKSEFCWWVGD